MIQRRLTVLLLACMLVGAAIGTFVELGGVGWDFANYYNAGLKVLSGQPVDVYDPDATIDGRLPEGTRKFLGTPLTAVFSVPLALMPRPTATVAFKLESTVAILLGLLLLYLHLRRIRASPPAGERSFALLYVFLALVFQPFWTVYRVGGQWTPTAFLFLVLALRFHASARYTASAFWTALAVTLKPGLLPALALLALLSERRFFVRAVIFSALFALVSLAAMGWESHVQFVLRASEVGPRREPWVHNSSIAVPLTTVH
ncbi:MAG: glycosyltransferase 87 family protein, partial [Planctomycetota bacterium]